MDDASGAIEIRLSRDISFLSAAMMGIGATVGAGIFVLLGFAAGIAGPSLLVAILLNGIVAGLTAMTYADLGTTFPEAGGGYLWVREALPNPAAFAAGWMGWFGHMVAGAVAALGFGFYVAWGLEGWGWLGPFTVQGATILIALLVTGALVALGYVGAQTRRGGVGVVGFVKLGILVALVGFGLVSVLGAPAATMDPFFVQGTAGILTAMALTFIAFQGYEVIAQAGEEVRHPERTIPRAMFLSLAVVVALYLVVAYVSLAATPADGSTPWERLAAMGPVAIVNVGERVIPAIGGPLLAAGGLLATLAALNTTLFSASRLSFAMGRDEVLPRSLGRVHPRFRAPSTAILLSGAVMLLLVLFSDLVVVATSAGLAFLLAFVLVNLALVRWRLRHPEVRRGFTAPLFPLVPTLGIVANLLLVAFLLFEPTGQVAWEIIVVWVGLGLLLYYPFRGRQDIAKPLPKRIDLAQLLAAETAPVELEKYRVFVPLREFSNLGLVRLGAHIAAAHRGELSLMNVLEIPRSLPPKAIRFHYVDERIKGLRKVEKVARGYDVDTRATVRIGHQPYEIVLRTIEEEDANVLVLGWRGDRAPEERRILGSTIDYLVQRAPCDVVVARTGGLKDRLDRVLLYAPSEDHAQGAAELAAILAAPTGAAVTVLEVAVDGRATGPPVDGLAATLEAANLSVDVKRLTGRDPVEVVAAESRNHDLLVVGAGERWALRKHAFGPAADAIAARSSCPVVLFRRDVRRIRGAVSPTTRAP